MNKVILLCRLTGEPEIRYSQVTNIAVAKFGIAVGRRFKKAGEADADFFQCVSFGKQAEFVEKYLKKGTKILLTGSVENNNYTNKEGVKVYATVINANEIEFAEGKGTESSEPGQNTAGGKKDDGFINIPTGLEEKLPFM
jgi:single-strand DNA-binding protein